MPPRSSRPGPGRVSASTWSRTRPPLTMRWAATSRRDLARRRGDPPADPAGRVRPAVDGGHGRSRPGDARVPGGRFRRLRLWQQLAGPGEGRGRRERVRLSGVRAGIRAAPVLRGPRTIPLGRPERRPGRHRPDGPGDPRAVPGRFRASSLADDGRREGAVPGPPGPDLLARLRRAGEGGP